jgi:hypothetical protein
MKLPKTLRQRVANMSADQFLLSVSRWRSAGRSVIALIGLLYLGMLWLYIEVKPQCEAVKAFEGKYGSGRPLRSPTLTGQLQEIIVTASNEHSRQVLGSEFDVIILNTKSQWESRLNKADTLLDDIMSHLRYLLIPVSYAAAWCSPEEIGTEDFVTAGIAEGFFGLMLGGVLLLYANTMELVRD